MRRKRKRTMKIKAKPREKEDLAEEMEKTRQKR